MNEDTGYSKTIVAIADSVWRLEEQKEELLLAMNHLLLLKALQTERRIGFQRIDAYEHKDRRSALFLKRALENNCFIKNLNLSPKTLNQMIRATRLERCYEGAVLIQQGGVGDHLFISGDGAFEVRQDGRLKRLFGPQVVFGEIALLSNTSRTATVRCILSGFFYVLDKIVFRQILGKSRLLL